MHNHTDGDVIKNDRMWKNYNFFLHTQQQTDLSTILYKF